MTPKKDVKKFTRARYSVPHLFQVTWKQFDDVTRNNSNEGKTKTNDDLSVHDDWRWSFFLPLSRISSFLLLSLFASSHSQKPNKCFRLSERNWARFIRKILLDKLSCIFASSLTILQSFTVVIVNKKKVLPTPHIVSKQLCDAQFKKRFDLVVQLAEFLR